MKEKKKKKDCPDFRCQPCGLTLSCLWPRDWKLNFPSPQLHAQKLSRTSDQTQETSYSLSSL